MGFPVLFQNAALDYGCKKFPRGIESADLNSDGSNDIVVCSSTKDIVTIFYNNSLGQFNEPVEIDVGKRPLDLVTIDVDNDSDIDIVTANQEGHSISLLIWEAPSFVRTDYQLSGEPLGITSGDLNSDGYTDICVSLNDQDQIAIFLGTENGLIFLKELTTLGGPTNLIIRDFDSDGYKDISLVCGGVFPDYLGYSMIFFNNETLGFSEELLTPLGISPIWLDAGDWNSNGKPDLVFAHGPSDDVVLLENLGGRTFQKHSFNCGFLPSGVKFADFDRNGILEFCLWDTNENFLEGFDFTQSEGIASLYRFGVGNGPTAITVSDLNGDSLDDLAISNELGQSVTVFLYQDTPDNRFIFPETFSSHGENPRSVKILDIDSDLRNDFIVLNEISGGIAIYRNTASGFILAETIGIANNPTDFEVLDLDSDGDLDLAIALANIDLIREYRNDGTGHFTVGQDYAVGDFPIKLAVNDVNSDGLQDLFVLNFFSGDIEILQQQQEGGFLSFGNYTVGSGAKSFVVADFSGDGNKDFIVSNFSNNNLMLFSGNDSGQFSLHNTINTGETPWGIDCGYYNEDTLLDFAVALFGDGKVQVFINQGNFQFSVFSEYNTGSAPTGLKSIDINKDSFDDLVVSNRSSNSISVLLGQNSAGFNHNFYSFAVGSHPMEIAIGDLSGDGTLDLIVANNEHDNVSVLMNSLSTAPFPYECLNDCVELWMPSELFGPGDRCTCEVRVCNLSGEDLTNVHLFVILDLYGQLFWGPDFSDSPTSYIDSISNFNTPETSLTVIPEFFWPKGAGSALGIYFYSAITDYEVAEILGGWDSWGFGWEE